MSIAPLTSQLSSLSLTQNATSSSKTPYVHKITDFIPKPPGKPEGKSLQNRVSQFENCEEKSSSRVATIPEYFRSSSYYASYKEIEEAINPWGKIDAVLTDRINTMFIVSFKEEIQIQTTENLFFDHPFPIPNIYNSVLGDTPFDLRGMYLKNGCSCDNLILSKKLMAFSLKKFKKNRYNWDPAINRASNPDEITRLKQLDHKKKKKQLLQLLKDSGVALLKKGVMRHSKNSNSLQSPSIEEIIQNYENHKWKVIHRVK